MKQTKVLVGSFLIVCLVAQAVLPQLTPQRKSPGRRSETQQKSKKRTTISADIQAALERISADSLRGHLSFIASDLLEGRNTPSRGLDIAAEYIAAQFRRVGLEPAGDAANQSYFQTSEWIVAETSENVVTLVTDDGKQKMQIDRNELGQDERELQKRAFKIHNVIGLLRGSDPTLKETYVIVSAHYDHIGVKAEGEGDLINNGANDDGSGTASVVELASALAGLKRRPKRSILFIAWFGEERGLRGSRYYGLHPVFPLDQTVAMINLETLGRTDDIEGTKHNSATLTGFDFTDLSQVFKAAGERTGIKIYKHERNSDEFFDRSDNQALADAGVPAHTLCVAFIYPDYHQVGDHWDKIDYANMAKINRMIALALIMIADNPKAPRWNEANPKTEKYVRAWKEIHGK